MAWEAGYRDVGWNMSFPNYLTCHLFSPGQPLLAGCWSPIAVRSLTVWKKLKRPVVEKMDKGPSARADAR